MIKILRPSFIPVSLAAAPLLLSFAGSAVALDSSEDDYELKLLGKYVFFDKISQVNPNSRGKPQRMGCVTCHDPATGGTGSVSGVNRHQVAITGANPHTIGNLKPPTNAYASFIAPLHNSDEGCDGGVVRFCGGNFWNGRAEGRDETIAPLFGLTEHIGSEVFQDGAGDPASYSKYFGPTSDQALNPMPNPAEHNIDRESVCKRVKSAKYSALYKKAWGIEIDCTDYDITFKRLMLAVGAWQHSNELNSFSSKRDIALAKDADKEFPLDGLTDEENLGHDLFYGVVTELNPEGKDARCSQCHSDNPDSDNGAEPQQLYADDSYHNIGTPRNPEIPKTFDANGNFLDPDEGLAGLTGIRGQIETNCGPGFTRNCDHRGFFKTPTLRNVDKRKGKGFTKAYTHNGWFKSLESIVHFYNTAFLGDEDIPYENTTAAKFGITRCPEGIETEKQALANNCWPEPAHANPGQTGSPAIPFLLGNLGLTAEEEAAIVAYMKTLTDTVTPKAPKPYK